MQDTAVTLTKQGIAKHAAGETAAAAALFVQAVQIDPSYEMAWLWLSSCLTAPGEKGYCLEQALLTNPQSVPARKGLTQLGDVRVVRPAALGGDDVVAPPAELVSTQPKQCPHCGAQAIGTMQFCASCGKRLSDPPSVPAHVVIDPRGWSVCSACRGVIRGDAVACKHCRVIFGTTPTSGQVSAQATPKKKDLPNWAIYLIVSVVVIGVWAAITVFPAGSSTPKTPHTPDAFDAYYMCQQFVTDRLKSPATAVFPLSTDTQTDKLSTVQFRNIAYVDSQNGFGANIRTHYTCTVTNTGGDSWHLDDLQTVP